MVPAGLLLALSLAAPRYVTEDCRKIPVPPSERSGFGPREQAQMLEELQECLAARRDAEYRQSEERRLALYAREEEFAREHARAEEEKRAEESKRAVAELAELRRIEARKAEPETEKAILEGMRCFLTTRRSEIMAELKKDAKYASLTGVADLRDRMELRRALEQVDERLATFRSAGVRHTGCPSGLATAIAECLLADLEGCPADVLELLR